MKETKPLLLVALVAAMAVTPACIVGPNYVKPTVPVAGSFKEPVPANFKEAPGWKQGQPNDDMRKGKWWEIFADPNLNALEEQIDIGNQSLAAEEATYRSARAAIRVAHSGLYPTVTGGASVIGSGTSGKVGAFANSAGAQQYAVLEPTAGVSWAPDVFGSIRRTIESVTDTAQATAGDLENLRLLIQSEVALDYFQLHGLDAEKILLDTNVTAYEKALQLTQNRYNQGVASQVDVAQAQTQLEQTRAQSTDTLVQRRQLEHAIAILLGKPPSEFSIPVGTLPKLPPWFRECCRRNFWSDGPILLPRNAVWRRRMPTLASPSRLIIRP